MSLSSAQCRAARGLLKWSQEELSAAARCAKQTVANFELEHRTAHSRTLEAIRAALEKGGVEFVEMEDGGEEAIRLRPKRKPRRKTAAT